MDGVGNALKDILAMLPSEVNSFGGTEYPLPIAQTFLGTEPVDLVRLRASLAEWRDSDPKTLLMPLLIAMEQCEAASADRAQFFIEDRQVQSLVFTGSKWRAGWVLVLGDGQEQKIAELLKARSFMVFTDQPGVDGTICIGTRDTSPVYFLQLMVRYGLIWGGIRPGDDHEMGHFLERDMPGFMVIASALPPLKYLAALGLMKLGCPAVVPSTFPFPYGNRVVAELPEDIVERGGRFPNLRQRYYRSERVELPAFCHPAWASETFDAAVTLGGDSDSFFLVRHTGNPVERTTVLGESGTGIGILVEVHDGSFSEDIEVFVEGHALKALNYLKGVRAKQTDSSFTVELAEGVELAASDVSLALYWGIRVRFPGLEQIGVTVIRDAEQLARMSAEVHANKEARRQKVAAMTEANTAEFCVCTECRPFSLVHTCVATPEREPMCASRTYASIKAAALYDSADVPWQRPGEQDVALRAVVRKGAVLDSARGEYEGVNNAYALLTGGKLGRVFLHSLRAYPHTSCGCFQTLAFWIPEVKGIGIMLRGSKAIAPGGATWAELANRAGGKQTPGITGVSIQYIRSPVFLRGDGGIANVVWTDSVLCEKINDLFAPGQKVATEKDVADIESLGLFIGRKACVPEGQVPTV